MLPFELRQPSLGGSESEAVAEHLADGACRKDNKRREERGDDDPPAQSCRASLPEDARQADERDQRRSAGIEQPPGEAPSSGSLRRKNP